MIQCSCGKTLDKVPNWLAGANVAFVCNNCPNRQTKNIAFMSLESDSPKSTKADDESAVDVEEEDADED